LWSALRSGPAPQGRWSGLLYCELAIHLAHFCVQYLAPFSNFGSGARYMWSTLWPTRGQNGQISREQIVPNNLRIHGPAQREGKDRGCGGRDDPARRRRVHRGVGRPAGCALAAVRVCHRRVRRRRRRSLDDAADRPPRSEDARGVRPLVMSAAEKRCRGPRRRDRPTTGSRRTGRRRKPSPNWHRCPRPWTTSTPGSTH